MVMSLESTGPLASLLQLTQLGLGGAIAGGRQYMSWVHFRDFTRAITFLLDRSDITGPVNIASPNPIPQREFMATLRSAAGMPFGLRSAAWMVEIGAFLLRTETELLFKSRRVTPRRLLEAGFIFEHPNWEGAAEALVAQKRRTA